MRIIIIILFFSIDIMAKSQAYSDSLIYKDDKYYFIKVDSLYYDDLRKINSNNIISYKCLEDINELKNIEKYSTNVSRKGLELIFKITNNVNVKLTDDTIDGESLRVYKFIDFNKIINCYIVEVDGWEYYTFLLINAYDGKKYFVPASMKLLIRDKIILGTFIDFVNGPSSLQAYSTENNNLKSFYEILDEQSKWLFNDALINSDREVVVRCQKKYSEEAFSYYRIIKK